LSSLIVIGGDDTLGVAIRLHNDFWHPRRRHSQNHRQTIWRVTDFSFGFDTAVNIVTEAVDRLRTTAESHRRIIVVENDGTTLRLDRLLRRYRDRSRLHPRARSADRFAALDRGLVKPPAPSARSTAWSSSPKGPNFPTKLR